MDRPPRHVRVLIVGSGFSGLGLAIRLQQAGRTDFVVIERGADVGGTWRDNTYPGAACDIPSHLYSYSFAPNRHWTRAFSPAPEIWAYLRRLAVESGTLDRHVFDCALRSARWDQSASHWVIETSRGSVTATVLVTAFGALCEPRQPALPGLDDFAGPVFHSARWDHDFAPAGRRIAVIGTGASAIQIVPELAAIADRVDVYQRTPPWVLPRRDRAFRPWERFAVARVPGYQRTLRTAIYWGRELTVAGFAYRPQLLGVARWVASRHLARQVAQPAFRRALTPRYDIGCKRILISDDWYPALQRANVELVTEGVREVRPHTIVSTDGTVREVDAIVLATGFRVTDNPAAELIAGADGRTLAEVWRASGQRAYKGTTVSGFPNCFLLIGPNTGLGHTSMIYMIESQLAYVLAALDTMDREGLATVDVRPDTQDRYNAWIQRRMARTVWTTGCASWYLDANGRNTTLWPSFTFRFRAMTRRFDGAAYRTKIAS
jgi:cation diffusion facilitator CzcD-associated flavoprotein CzcO